MAPFADLFSSPENIILGVLVMVYCIFFFMGIALVAFEGPQEKPKKKQ